MSDEDKSDSVSWYLVAVAVAVLAVLISAATMIYDLRSRVTMLEARVNVLVYSQGGVLDKVDEATRR